MKLLTALVAILLLASCQKELTPIQDASQKESDSKDISIVVTVLQWPWPEEKYAGQFGLEMKSSQRLPADCLIKVSFYIDWGNGNILQTYTVKGFTKGNWWQTCPGGYAMNKVTRFKLEGFTKVPGYNVSVTLK